MSQRKASSYGFVPSYGDTAAPPTIRESMAEEEGVGACRRQSGVRKEGRKRGHSCLESADALQREQLQYVLRSGDDGYSPPPPWLLWGLLQPDRFVQREQLLRRLSWKAEDLKALSRILNDERNETSRSETAARDCDHSHETARGPVLEDSHVCVVSESPHSTQCYHPPLHASDSADWSASIVRLPAPALPLPRIPSPPPLFIRQSTDSENDNSISCATSHSDSPSYAFFDDRFAVTHSTIGQNDMVVTTITGDQSPTIPCAPTASVVDEGVLGAEASLPSAVNSALSDDDDDSVTSSDVDSDEELMRFAQKMFLPPSSPSALGLSPHLTTSSPFGDQTTPPPKSILQMKKRKKRCSLKNRAVVESLCLDQTQGTMPSEVCTARLSTSSCRMRIQRDNKDVSTRKPKLILNEENHLWDDGSDGDCEETDNGCNEFINKKNARRSVMGPVRRRSETAEKHLYSVSSSLSTSACDSSMDSSKIISRSNDSCSLSSSSDDLDDHTSSSELNRFSYEEGSTRKRGLKKASVQSTVWRQESTPTWREEFNIVEQNLLTTPLSEPEPNLNSRPLTTAELKAILADDDYAPFNAANWVRRSARLPSRSALSAPHVQSLVQKLVLNDPDMLVLKLKKYLSDPDTPCVIIDAMLDALGKNTNCQALYIQNFNEGMRDDQVLHLIRVLQRPNCRIWCLNIGETYKVKTRTWAAFTKGLANSNITHMYASEHTISAAMKDKIRDTIRENRSKHTMHNHPENLDVIVQCTHCWWNPINAKVLQPFIHKRGFSHLLLDKIAQGVKGTETVEPSKI